MPLSRPNRIWVGEESGRRALRWTARDPLGLPGDCDLIVYSANEQYLAALSLPLGLTVRERLLDCAIDLQGVTPLDRLRNLSPAERRRYQGDDSDSLLDRRNPTYGVEIGGTRAAVCRLLLEGDVVRYAVPVPIEVRDGVWCIRSGVLDSEARALAWAQRAISLYTNPLEHGGDLSAAAQVREGAAFVRDALKGAENRYGAVDRRYTVLREAWNVMNYVLERLGNGRATRG